MTRLSFPAAIAAVVVLAMSASPLMALSVTTVPGAATAPAMLPKMADPPIKQATVDGFIADLRSNQPAVRQNAIKALIDSAKARPENLPVIRDRLTNVPGQGVQDPDINARFLSDQTVGMLPFDPLAIVIDDRTENIIATKNGKTDDVTIQPGDAKTNSPEMVSIEDVFFAALDPATPPKPIFLIEDGAPLIDGRFSPVSDIISITFLPKGFLLFSSDLETPLGGQDCTQLDIICIPENGEPFDVAKIWFGNDRTTYMSIKVMSDVEPEPSTVALLATGMLGVGAYGIRRRRGRARERE